jgi:3-hydroxyacyl-CoA dehydrogenase
MNLPVEKIAVIGSGVMGAGIAAHIANSGLNVWLFDMVPDGASDRSILARQAIERMKQTEPSPIMHKSMLKQIHPANLEDDLSLLGQMDWIIEVIVEKLPVKQSLYEKIESVRRSDTIISSNTSTIPLARLIEGRSQSFQEHFLITHFFNPPRYMQLLELVQGAKTNAYTIALIRRLADEKLGKSVVLAKDTAGFIANRIGCYWMIAGLHHAIKMNVSVELADAVLGRPIGIPKTGLFGLFDLIGIDLIPLIADAMIAYLPIDDDFVRLYQLPDLVKNMIQEGYTGRKGKGGFYVVEKKADGSKVKKVKDLRTGLYREVEKPELESLAHAKKDIRALVDYNDLGGQYARAVLRDTCAYAASLIPEIADDVASIDEAMRTGYNWKYGPFEWLERLSNKEQHGAQWCIDQLTLVGKTIPPLLKEVSKERGFYYQEANQSYYRMASGYTMHKLDSSLWQLSDYKRYISDVPVYKNGAGALWDLGDGVACLDWTTKMKAIDPNVLELVNASLNEVKKGFNSLVMGTGSEPFSVGANLGFLLYAANLASWKMIDEVIQQGQETWMAVKYAPFPVVAAASGLALGGGCELLLHVDAVQAHAELYTGLVEVGVGVVPGWGGCKEMVMRHLAKRREADHLTAKLGQMFSAIPLIKGFNTMPPIMQTFELIGLAKVSKSAYEARDMGILNKKSRISMNRQRVLSDAKLLALSLVPNYQIPLSDTIYLPGKTARKALGLGISQLQKQGKASNYDALIADQLAAIITGGDTSISRAITEEQLLRLEREAFSLLIRQKPTWDRIEYMLEHSKPLRN